MKLIKLPLIGLFALMTACATVHPGKDAHSVSKESMSIPLKVSGLRNTDYENSSMELVEVTLENTSDDWVRIDNVEALIGNPAESKVSVVQGQDLVDWATAVEMKARMDQYNRSLLTTSALIAVEAFGSERNRPSIITSAVLASTYGWVVVDAMRGDYVASRRAKKVPGNHLTTAISVPPKMFLRRWILLNKPPSEKMDKLVFEVETVEGKKGVYAIDL